MSGAVLLGGVEFDGFTWGVDAARILPLLYLAAKARAGDDKAKELLDAFGFEVRDSHGKLYYPPEAVEVAG